MRFNALHERAAFDLQAMTSSAVESRCTNVRFGILASQSGFRRNDELSEKRSCVSFDLTGIGSHLRRFIRNLSCISFDLAAVSSHLKQFRKNLT